MPRRFLHTGRVPRLRGHAYDGGGSYLVTLCVHKRAPILGRVADGRMYLSAAGGDVLAVWLDLPVRYPHVELDACMVMPDHVHAILGLPNARPGCHGLNEVVRNWKSCSARRINTRRATPGCRVWQRSFYGHVVRGPRDLDRIRRYVEENPKRWSEQYGSGKRR